MYLSAQSEPPEQECALLEQMEASLCMETLCTRQHLRCQLLLLVPEHGPALLFSQVLEKLGLALLRKGNLTMPVSDVAEHPHCARSCAGPFTGVLSPVLMVLILLMGTLGLGGSESQSPVLCDLEQVTCPL